MATSDAFRELLAGAIRTVAPATWTEPEDLVRMGRESLIADEYGDARILPSEGTLRLHGGGVVGHAVDLDEVGFISAQWQRAVTAMGAALEGVATARGQVPADIRSRTRLSLVAAPGTGSVVLNIAPKSAPLPEVAPDGAVPLIDAPHPLADRASSRLIGLLSEAGSATAETTDAITGEFRDLGPRVASALQGLATRLAASDISLDVAWREPEAPTVRASLNSSQARWLREFIEGRELDASTDELEGTVVTVSNRERWLVETELGPERVVASKLGLGDVRRVRSGDNVRLRVRTTTRTQPDGTNRVRREAIEIMDVTQPEDDLENGDMPVAEE
jgi:hypothetical protein